LSDMCHVDTSVGRGDKYSWFDSSDNPSL